MSNSGTYHLYKMTKSTPCFKKGQKVWVSQGKCEAIAYGRYKGNLQWIGAFIRPERECLHSNPDKCLIILYSNHGKPNAKYIGTVELSGYLHDLFTLMDYNKRRGVKLILDDIRYKASVGDILRLHDVCNEMHEEEKRNAIRLALHKQREAIIQEIKEDFGIDLRDPCAKMSINDMRKLDWLKR